MTKLFIVLILLIVSVVVTFLLVALSPIVTLYSLYRGNTHVYEALCDELQDLYYVIGKNLLRSAR